MSASRPSRDPFRVGERKQRKKWARYAAKHQPPPKRSSNPGRWMLPAWEGPWSAQSPVWVEDEPSTLF